VGGAAPLLRPADWGPDVCHRPPNGIDEQDSVDIWRIRYVDGKNEKELKNEQR